MPLLRRRPVPLPPSERIYPDVPWVEPAAVATPWWRRALSAVELTVLVIILGLVLTLAVGVTLLGSFFLFDYLIS